MFAPIVRGGIIMIPLLLCSMVALIICVERWLYLRHARVNTGRLMDKIHDALERGSPEEARGVCEATPGPVARVLSSALAHFRMARENLREVAREEALAQQPILDGQLALLGTIVTIAPLLGLLGTISGLIKVFQVIAGGDIGNPTVLSAGIAEALITTFTGLCIAITFLVLHNSLTGRVESLVHEMELRFTELLNLHASGKVGQ